MSTDQPDLFNLVEYQRRNGFWTPFKTHIVNRPYGICKARKNELESDTSQVSVKFFKIEKPKR
jgi:hypothetical protein